MQPSSFEFLPPPSKLGSSIFLELDNRLGTLREDQIYSLAAMGCVPTFLRQWLELPVSFGSLSGTIYVLPDYFCLGTNEDYLYVPMGALNAERVGALFNARLPTKRLVQLMYNQGRKQVAQPWGAPYDGSMSHTSRWPKQTFRVRDALNAQAGELTEGHFKSIITSKRTMDNEGKMLGFWGWFDKAGKPIQGDSQAHGAGYCDYSHGAHYIANEMVLDGQLLDVGEVLRHRDYYRVISDEQFGTYTTYLDVRRACGILTLLY